MSADFDSEPFLDKAVSPDVIFVIVSFDDSFRGMLFKERRHLPCRVAAPGIKKEPVHKIGGDPVEGISPNFPAHANLDNLLELFDFDNSLPLADGKPRISLTDHYCRNTIKGGKLSNPILIAYICNSRLLPETFTSIIFKIGVNFKWQWIMQRERT